MAIETIAEYSEPDLGRDDPAVRADVPAGPTLDASATAAIRQLLDEHPEIAKEIRELLRTRVHLEELTRRGEETNKAAAEAEQRQSSLALKFDPGGRRTLGFGLGAVIVGVLAVLDAVPLNWAAQAFGLDPSGTWLVTFHPRGRVPSGPCWASSSPGITGGSAACWPRWSSRATWRCSACGPSSWPRWRATHSPPLSCRRPC